MAVIDNPGMVALLAGVIGALCKTLVDVVQRKKIVPPQQASLTDILRLFLEQQKSFREQEMEFIAKEFQMNRELSEVKWLAISNGLLDVKNDLVKMHTKYHDISAPLQSLVVKMELLMRGQIRPETN